MAEMKPDAGGKYRLTDWHHNRPLLKDTTTPDDRIDVLPDDIGDAGRKIRLVITIDENGEIRSYNHGSTPQAERVKILPDNEPYELGTLHAAASITVMVYQEPNKAAELGIWYNTSTGRKMTS